MKSVNGGPGRPTVSSTCSAIRPSTSNGRAGGSSTPEATAVAITPAITRQIRAAAGPTATGGR